jgi:hypothetical protein
LPLPVLRRCLFFAVACSCCHQRVFPARRIPMNSAPLQPSTLSPTKSPPLLLPVLARHSGAARISVLALALAVPCPLFPVPCSLLSSPSNPQIPPNLHQPNNINLSRSWHTSFPPSRIIKTVSKTKQTRPNPPGLRI